MTAEYVHTLITGYRTGTLSRKEVEELQLMINSDEFEQLAHVIDQDITEQIKEAKADPLWQQWQAGEVWGKIKADLVINSTEAIQAKSKLFTLHSWWKYAAAVCLLIGAATLFWFNQKGKQPLTGKFAHQQTKSQILPGSNKAILTLSNGREIQLTDSTSQLINDGRLAIQNSKGHLIYGSSVDQGTNTMTTPKGGQYQLILADGTRVWLNAASSITYPTAFMGSNRSVEINGEAYLEITPDKEKPFIITTVKTQVAVLGTSLNINAYLEEEATKISLLEGAIKINDQFIKPGQAWKNGQIISTNIKQDIAWKNGVFNFEGQGLAQVVRQIARWYDVEPVYTNGIPDVELGGSMDRSLTLDQLVQTLQDMKVNCHLEGRQLIIAP